MQNLVLTAISDDWRWAGSGRLIESTFGKLLSLMDTSVVLFFLAMEIGANGSKDLPGLLLGTLVLTVTASLPFWLKGAKSLRFPAWLAGRIVIASAGLTVGLFFGLATQAGALPGAARFVPLSLLIVAGIISCNVAIYGIIRDRLAR